MRSAGVSEYTDRCNARLTKVYCLHHHLYTDRFTCECTRHMPNPETRRAMLLLIVLSGVIISLCVGLGQGLGLFMRPMTVDLGISAAAFGFAIALQNIVWGLSQRFVGAAADRYGARPVLVVTALVYALGLVLMGFSGLFPGALHVAGFLAGIGTAGFGFGGRGGAGSGAGPPAEGGPAGGL